MNKLIILFIFFCSCKTHTCNTYSGNKKYSKMKNIGLNKCKTYDY